jgi:hypothetical protein
LLLKKKKKKNDRLLVLHVHPRARDMQYGNEIHFNILVAKWNNITLDPGYSKTWHPSTLAKVISQYPRAIAVSFRWEFIECTA